MMLTTGLQQYPLSKEESRTKSQLIADNYDEKSHSLSISLPSNNNINDPTKQKPSVIITDINELSLSHSQSNSNHIKTNHFRADSNTPLHRYSRRDIINDKIMEKVNNKILLIDEKDQKNDQKQIDFSHSNLLRYSFEKIANQFITRYDELFSQFKSISLKLKSIKIENNELKSKNKEYKMNLNIQSDNIRTLNDTISSLNINIKKYKLRFLDNINADLSNNNRKSLSSLIKENNDLSNTVITKQDIDNNEHSFTDLYDDMTPELDENDNNIHHNDYKLAIDDGMLNSVNDQFNYNHRTSTARNAIKPNTVAILTEKFNKINNNNITPIQPLTPLSPIHPFFNNNNNNVVDLSQTDSLSKRTRKPKYKNKKKTKKFYKNTYFEFTSN